MDGTRPLIQPASRTTSGEIRGTIAFLSKGTCAATQMACHAREQYTVERTDVRPDKRGRTMSITCGRCTTEGYPGGEDQRGISRCACNLRRQTNGTRHRLISREAAVHGKARVAEKTCQLLLSGRTVLSYENSQGPSEESSRVVTTEESWTTMRCRINVAARRRRFDPLCTSAQHQLAFVPAGTIPDFAPSRVGTRGRMM